MRRWRAMALVLTATATAMSAGAAQRDRMTLFNQGPALITEYRDLGLSAGEQVVDWPGLPRSLVAETLMLAGDDVRLAGYRDARELMRPQAVLSRLVGETVTLRRDDGEGGDIEREARLLTVSGGAPMVRMDGRIEVLDADSPWRIAADWPETLPENPGIALTLRSEAAGDREVALTYQTGGLEWNAEYVARYDDAERRLSLRGSALVRNGSGGDWHDATLTLVTGDIARADAGRPVPMAAMARMESAKDAGGAEPAFEYYRYRLDAPVTLRDGETVSLPLVEEVTLPVEREYRIEGGWRRVGDANRAHASIRLSFDNELGLPLPAGTVRVYDRADPPALLGEDGIGHTPEDVGAALTLGRSFDITAERKITAEVREGSARESERQITVANAKDQSVKVRIVEALPGDWEILSQNLPHEKLDANRASWMVGVPAGGKARLTYRVRWR